MDHRFSETSEARGESRARRVRATRRGVGGSALHVPVRGGGALLAASLAVGLAVLGSSGDAAAQSICGCESTPGLVALDTNDPASVAALGGTISSNVVTLPLPGDGVIRLASLSVVHAPGFSSAGLRFTGSSNLPVPPVTLLVAGDVTIGPNAYITVSGQDGTGGSSAAAGAGGAGGPGGFRGGDGAFQRVNQAANGGAGFGPAGGAAGTGVPLAAGRHGAFLGVPELLPLAGGSGGGGGGSSSTGTNCSGGGGGGGGGALLIAANGTIDLDGNIWAIAGGGTGSANGACASSGGSGSGGAVRLVANRVEGAGNIYVYGVSGSDLATAGRVRIEANEMLFPANAITPASVASFDLAPGPVVNPITPAVRITSVNGAAPPSPPLGALGRIDVVLQTGGVVPIGVETTNVPSGTTVEVTAKPRVGGAPIVSSATLDAGNCTGAGVCSALVAPDLTPGNWLIEARATFSTP